MQKIVIEGGRPLKGTVKISGAKNSALLRNFRELWFWRDWRQRELRRFIAFTTWGRPYDPNNSMEMVGHDNIFIRR